MTRIAVIDHGAGNLVSIAQGLRRAPADVLIVRSPEDLAGVDGIVLPGVGTTGAAMARLRTSGLAEALQAWEGPMLGICVGLQLFFDFSEEDGSSGLGLIPGRVSRLTDAPILPHIGWNDVHLRPVAVFAGIDPDPLFYFVHSYAGIPDDHGLVVAETTYGAPFAAGVRRGNLIGVQFHPERSGPAGLRVLANFVTESVGYARVA